MYNPKEITSIKIIYYNNKSRAIRKKLCFDITFEMFLKIAKNNCTYCNTPPRDIRIKGKIVKLNGLDRVNNSEGYTESNCVSCCSDCNYMKSNMSLRDFVDHLTRIVENYGKKKRS